MVISYLKTYMELYPQNDDLNEYIHKKEFDRIKAIKRLKPFGLVFSLNKDNELEFCNEKRIFSLISNNIRLIGSQRFINHILSMTPYDIDSGRLQFPKQGKSNDTKGNMPETPFGFLLNMGLSHLKIKGTQEALENYFYNVIALSVDICSAVCYKATLFGKTFFITKKMFVNTSDVCLLWIVCIMSFKAAEHLRQNLCRS